MQFHLPRPLHGWREFAGEVGIIVIGVLIALGAQQVAEAMQWRSQVGAFRAAVRQEVGWDLGTEVYRSREDGCVKARLDQLEQWLQGWQLGHPKILAGPIGSPGSLSPYTSAWQSRDPALMAHIPLEERLTLGYLYDELANNEVHRLDERQTWLMLAKYDGATALQHEDLMELRELISRARHRDLKMRENSPDIIATAKAMGITPKSRDFPAYEASLCRPILSSPAAGSAPL